MKPGGKCCFAGGGGGDLPTTFEWETVLDWYDLFDDVATKESLSLGNPGVDVQGWQLQTDEQVSFWLPVRNDYDDNGISIQAFGFLDGSASQPDTYSFDIEGRWFANDENLNQAFSNSTSFDIANAATGDVCLVSEIKGFTPDGSWAANKSMLAKITRTDSSSDDPRITQLKFRYTITL